MESSTDEEQESRKNTTKRVKKTTKNAKTAENMEMEPTDNGAYPSLEAAENKSDNVENANINSNFANNSEDQEQKWGDPEKDNSDSSSATTVEVKRKLFLRRGYNKGFI